ncbi:MAG: hypothetical protein H6831_01045 [Planctomycetes bacterium]|nr:hypothetical protein [Planctomycetota bacterium]
MRRTLTVLLLALAALPTLARRDGTEPPPLVPAAEVWDRPGEHVGREVRMVVQHAGWIEAWNPLTTRFGAGDYKAWSAWADEQLLWDTDDYEHPLVRLFVRRGGAAEWALEGLELYRRFEVVGEVKAVLDGQPWIELVGVRPLTEQIGDGSLVHAGRGFGAWERGEWRRAVDEFDRALASPLPPIAREELERLKALCRDRADHPTLEELVRRDIERKD